MATDTCNYRPRSSQCPGHSLFPTMDANWSRSHTVREMGKLGRSYFSCRGALRSGGKGAISLVATLVVHSPIHDFVLADAYPLNARLCLRCSFVDKLTGLVRQTVKPSLRRKHEEQMAGLHLESGVGSLRGDPAESGGSRDFNTGRASAMGRDHAQAAEQSSRR